MAASRHTVRMSDPENPSDLCDTDLSRVFWCLESSLPLLPSETRLSPCSPFYWLTYPRPPHLGQLAYSHILVPGNPAEMQLEDFGTRFLIRKGHKHPLLESPLQSVVKVPRVVRCREDDDPRPLCASQEARDRISRVIPRGSCDVSLTFG